MLNCDCFKAIPETVLLCTKKNFRLIYEFYLQNVFTNHIYLIYMYKEDLASYNLQWLICHKTQPNQIIYS